LSDSKDKTQQIIQASDLI